MKTHTHIKRLSLLRMYVLISASCMTLLSACGSEDNSVTSATPPVAPAGAVTSPANAGGPATPTAPVSIRRCAPGSLSAQKTANGGANCAKAGA